MLEFSQYMDSLRLFSELYGLVWELLFPHLLRITMLHHFLRILFGLFPVVSFPMTSEPRFIFAETIILMVLQKALLSLSFILQPLQYCWV